MNYPKEFENLIDSFRRFPGVGYKSAERMAYQYLEMKDEYKEKFVESLKDISHLKKCDINIDSKKYLNILYGRILYVLQINENDEEFIKYKDFIANLKRQCVS